MEHTCSVECRSGERVSLFSTSIYNAIINITFFFAVIVALLIALNDCYYGLAIGYWTTRDCQTVFMCAD